MRVLSTQIDQNGVASEMNKKHRLGTVHYLWAEWGGGDVGLRT